VDNTSNIPSLTFYWF